MKIRVLSCAEREFVDAVDRYNAERAGLGFEFTKEVKNRDLYSAALAEKCLRVSRHNTFSASVRHFMRYNMHGRLYAYLFIR